MLIWKYALIQFAAEEWDLDANEIDEVRVFEEDNGEVTFRIFFKHDTGKKMRICVFGFANEPIMTQIELAYKINRKGMGF